MTKPKKQDFPRIAREVAECVMSRIVEGYAGYVEKYIDNYEGPPDEADFLVWLENWGYESATEE